MPRMHCSHNDLLARSQGGGIHGHSIQRPESFYPKKQKDQEPILDVPAQWRLQDWMLQVKVFLYRSVYYFVETAWLMVRQQK